MNNDPAFAKAKADFFIISGYLFMIPVIYR